MIDHLYDYREHDSEGHLILSPAECSACALPKQLKQITCVQLRDELILEAGWTQAYGDVRRLAPQPTQSIHSTAALRRLGAALVEDMAKRQ